MSGAIAGSPIPAANVSSVPQRSPLRYPGGKTWLIPHVRMWLTLIEPRPRVLLEPFCGGAIVTLTAIMESLIERCIMADLDLDIADFWYAVLRHGPAMQKMIMDFNPTSDAVVQLKFSDPLYVTDRGFRSLILNRTQRQGIIAPGSSHLRSGENGKGLFSRWYPETISRRIDNIYQVSSQIEFFHSDGVDLLSRWSCVKDAIAFIDPPYTAGGKSAGKRLYRHHKIDHENLFRILADGSIDFMMTYDHVPEIIDLVDQHGFSAIKVSMDRVHHALHPELVITRDPLRFPK